MPQQPELHSLRYYAVGDEVPRNIVSFLHSHSCTSAVEPPTNRRGLILLFQSVLPFSLTLAKFHEAYVIAVHAWVKQWRCSDLLEWRPPHLPAAVRDGRLAASSRGRESRPTVFERGKRQQRSLPGRLRCAVVIYAALELDAGPPKRGSERRGQKGPPEEALAPEGQSRGNEGISLLTGDLGSPSCALNVKTISTPIAMVCGVHVLATSELTSLRFSSTRTAVVPQAIIGEWKPPYHVTREAEVLELRKELAVACDVLRAKGQWCCWQWHTDHQHSGCGMSRPRPYKRLRRGPSPPRAPPQSPSPSPSRRGSAARKYAEFSPRR
jgi:hypothetical protein